MAGHDDSKLVEWLGREVLPHERAVRVWLQRTLRPDDLEDVIQEAYCRIAALDDFTHIQNARAYFFTTTRMIVLEKIRRSRIVSIETVAEFDALIIETEDPSAERVLSGRRELERVTALIEALPDRCRSVFRLRKIEQLPQRQVAERMGIPEHTVEYEVWRALKLILRAMADGDALAEVALKHVGTDEHERNASNDR